MSPNHSEFGVDPESSILHSGVTGEEIRMVSPVGNQRIFYECVRDAILFGKPAPISLRDAIAVMAILEASFQSEVEGRTLPIPLTEGERAEWG
jgi:predicted dehydrogenase